MDEITAKRKNVEKQLRFRKKTARCYFYVNLETEYDVWEMLDLQRSKRKYIISLIRADIERRKSATNR